MRIDYLHGRVLHQVRETLVVGGQRAGFHRSLLFAHSQPGIVFQRLAGVVCETHAAAIEECVPGVHE
ncbi:hypothetical protein [Actinoallomurus sp. CA-150999]|uniref:hypothetical protein n=1 Tax=Actinoallomurus sp. CA-150999 TaxID=3239887 RepID=UPI003D8B6B8E